jgi:hypothetical protein
MSGDPRLRAGQICYIAGDDGMNWTTEPPTVQGVFWYREDGLPYLALTTMVFRRGHAGSLLRVVLRQVPWGLVPDRECDADQLQGEWAGPLSPPREA